MPDRIITVHISPYIAAQGTADDLAAMGVTTASDDLITMAARQMLTNHDAFMGGDPCDEAMEQRLSRAACFASAAYAAAPMEDAAPAALMRAFLLALVDPLHPDLDCLRTYPEAGAKARGCDDVDCSKCDGTGEVRRD
ncbi:hypothetical protein GCM10007291_07490 [Gemmobacter nanjingensis]|uniref:Uncharacterized protein n=1 Tax=Gemmobacter nanjingensis TaxID=488454 RepID=A0ABQ3F7Z0_9RHOB|nr:hypothetical protein [Gemmobacter nanjingensis]GHC12698.1 hypothetical protein GCM10007291_07490 [Gemmobacter nanjingensis]